MEKRAWNFVNLTGKRFGKLIAMSPVKKKKKGNIHWLCKCDCGNESLVVGCKLTSGHTKSCGCYKVEATRKHKTTHGHCSESNGLKHHSPEYLTWQNMMNRCRNPDVDSYPLYGGRGIKVCDRWLNSFEDFLADMGQKPAGYSIERRDNDKDYCPDNCYWATQSTQANNKRSNHKITFNGETRNLFQWARHLGIPPKRLSARIISGWSVERALTHPVRK